MEQLDSFKSLIPQLEKSWKQLVADNVQLRKSLESLFQEEEIKSCPSYELLKATYLVLEHTPAETHKEQVTMDLSSIYAPKWSHTKSKPVAKGTAKAQASISVAKSEIPLDECLLNTEINTVTNSIETIKVTIDDVTYYYVTGKFYAVDSGKCVGKLTGGVIMINGKPYTPEERKLVYVSDNYYKDRDDRAYVKCDDYIARVMGEIQDGNVYAYS